MSLAQALNFFAASPPVGLARTPIQCLHRIEDALGLVVEWRPRSMPSATISSRSAAAWRKLRKLEFLLGDAAAAGADTIIATGSRQSNFARLAAAAMLGR